MEVISRSKLKAAELLCRTSLTHEVSTRQVQLVPSWRHPHSSGVSADQAGLALGVLRQEGHHPLHWTPGYCGNALRSLQQGLEKTALIEDHVVWNADLGEKRSGERAEPGTQQKPKWIRSPLTMSTCHQWSSLPWGLDGQTPVRNQRLPLASSAQAVPPPPRAMQMSSRPWASLPQKQTNKN